MSLYIQLNLRRQWSTSQCHPGAPLPICRDSAMTDESARFPFFIILVIPGYAAPVPRPVPSKELHRSGVYVELQLPAFRGFDAVWGGDFDHLDQSRKTKRMGRKGTTRRGRGGLQKALKPSMELGDRVVDLQTRWGGEAVIREGGTMGGRQGLPMRRVLA